MKTELNWRRIEENDEVFIADNGDLYILKRVEVEPLPGERTFIRTINRMFVAALLSGIGYFVWRWLR